jgi:hypothetical protein
MFHKGFQFLKLDLTIHVSQVMSIVKANSYHLSFRKELSFKSLFLAIMFHREFQF